MDNFLGRKYTMATGSSKTDAVQGRASNFSGPCKAFCMPMASCCVDADADWLCCCVPIKSPDYILPLCLHMCLCPQQGCDPIPTLRSRDKPKTAYKQNVAANLCCMCVQNAGGEIFLYTCCWRLACCNRTKKGCGDTLLISIPCCWAVLPLIVEGR